MLLQGLFKLVLIASIFAWPVAYLAMQTWLQDFAYRAGFDVWTLIWATLTTLAIAVLSVSFQAIRAALANPVEALRYE